VVQDKSAKKGKKPPTKIRKSNEGEDCKEELKKQEGVSRRNKERINVSISSTYLKLTLAFSIKLMKMMMKAVVMMTTLNK
jgi:hypothetical protein